VEITLSSSDMYDDVVAAIAKLEAEAARLKALDAAARLPMMQAGPHGRTEHITCDDLLEWLANAEDGKAVIYATSAGWFAKDAANIKEGPDLMLLANKIHELAQDGWIRLTQRTSELPSDKARVFEYRATKASERRPPAWRPDWLG
jgi:hypothetical protein